jgi:EAL domain-containing protein (putative c-di-GMP-specific phosphodiesterase class I)
VVAEGVETQAHLERLDAYGCDFAQGFFIGEPMPPPAFQAWRDNYRHPPRKE